MANKRASISAGLRADASGWARGCNEARAHTQKLKQDIEATKINGPSSSFDKFKNSATNAKAKLDLFKEAFDKVASVVTGPMEANAWMGDMTDQLSAVIGNSEEAAAIMRTLRAVAIEQSLTDDQLQLLVAYSERMISLGYSAEETAGMMREIANAAEWAGRGVEDFGGMIMALDKVKQSGEASVKTISKLSEEVPALRDALKSAFGSNVAEDIEKLKLSSEELTAGIVKGLKTIETSRPSTNESLLADRERVKQITLNRQDNLKLKFSENLPERKQESADDLKAETAKRAAERQAAEAQEKDLKRREAVNQAISDMRSEYISAGDEAMAIAEGDQKALERMEDQREIAEQLNKLREQGLELDRDQVDAVNKLVEARRADKQAAAAVKEKNDIAKSEQDLKIQGLRHMGRNRRADKEEDKAKVKELMDGGMSEAGAKFVVDRQRQQAQDEALGPRRRRIRGLKKDAPKVEIPKDAAAEAVKVPEAKPAAPAKPGKSEDTNYLKQIAENTKPTAADRQKPVNRR